MRRRFRLALLIAGLTLAGCGGPASPAGGQPAASPAGPKPAGSSPASAAEAAAAKPAAGGAGAEAKPPSSAKPSAASAVAKPASGGAAAKPAAGSQAAKPAASGGIAVKAGYIEGSFTNSPVYVANAIGAFARQGLNVTLTDTAATAQSAALSTGDIQFGTLGSAELVNANIAGTPYVMVASLADVPAFSLYAKPGIKAMNDLAGKQVGVGRLGSATYLAAELFLRQYGLTGKAKIVATGGADPAVVAAMTNGQLEAGILSPPSTSVAAKAGYTELVNGPKLGVAWTTTGVMINRDLLKQRPDVVRRYLRGLQEAWTYITDASQKDGVIKALVAQTKSNTDLAATGYDYMFPVWTMRKSPLIDPQAIATAISLSTDPKAANLKPEDLIDNGILQSVLNG